MSSSNCLDFELNIATYNLNQWTVYGWFYGKYLKLKRTYFDHFKGHIFDKIPKTKKKKTLTRTELEQN